MPSEHGALFLDDDAHGDSTLWGRDTSEPDRPEALLRKRDIPERWRESVWSLVGAALARETPTRRSAPS